MRYCADSDSSARSHRSVANSEYGPTTRGRGERVPAAYSATLTRAAPARAGPPKLRQPCLVRMSTRVQLRQAGLQEHARSRVPK